MLSPTQNFENSNFEYESKTSRSMISEKIISKPKNIFKKSASQEAKDYEKWMHKHMEEMKNDI